MIDEIVLQVDDRDMARLASVCRAMWAPACRLVWEEIENVEALASLVLPESEEQVQELTVSFSQSRYHPLV